MKASSFLGERPESTIAARVPQSDKRSEYSDAAESQVAPAGGSVIQDITPNGTELTYRPEQWVDGKKVKRQYTVNGVVVPSVTTVLDVLNKGGLTIWGQRVGIQGVLTLFEQSALTTEMDWDNGRELVAIAQGEDSIPADMTAVEALMKERKLTTNDVKGSAADRGSIVHQALEDWAKFGHVPNPNDFDEREQGYIAGIAAFIVDADPTPIRQEVMVGSGEHGFAGRYDIELAFTETRRVRLTPKQKWHEVGPGDFLTDAKSSSGVYPSTHFRQLSGYEGARIECGYEPTDGQYVLHVDGKGSYAFVPSNAIYDDFLAVLSVYRSNERMAKKAA